VKETGHEQSSKGGGHSCPPFRGQWHSGGRVGKPALRYAKQDFNYGRFAVNKTNGGLDSIHERLAATVKKSLTVKTDGELCPNPVVRDSRTTACNGKAISSLLTLATRSSETQSET